MNVKAKIKPEPKIMGSIYDPEDPNYLYRDGKLKARDGN